MIETTCSEIHKHCLFPVTLCKHCFTSWNFIFASEKKKKRLPWVNLLHAYIYTFSELFPLPEMSSYSKIIKCASMCVCERVFTYIQLHVKSILIYKVSEPKFSLFFCCREESVLTPCWNCVLDLLSFAIITHDLYNHM